MNTPMQELIEQLKEYYDLELKVSGTKNEPILWAIGKAQALLKKEKEMLAGVWLDAQVAYQGDEYIKVSDPTFDEYYETTFNTEEK